MSAAGLTPHPDDAPLDDDDNGVGAIVGAEFFQDEADVEANGADLKK